MIHISNNLLSILDRIYSLSDNPISGYLLTLNDNNINKTFLSCDNSDDPIITYYKSSIAKKILGDKFNSRYLNRLEIDNLFKDIEKHATPSSIRIGKFIKDIYNFSSKDIEEFVNLFKAVKININKYNIIVVKGNDIKKYYDFKNYLNVRSRFLNSCMSKMTPNTFNLYSKNPDVCNMVVILDNEKVIARALVWKLDKAFKGKLYFMDRIYSINDSTTQIMKIYANEKNWIIKDDYNSYCIKSLSVTIKNYKHEMYPYMDTFKRLDNGKLTTDSDYKNFGKILESTYGRYEKCSPSFINRINRLLKLKNPLY